VAKLETEHVFEGDVQKVFAGISQYSLYPEYLPAVTKVEVLKPRIAGSTCQVRYELNLIKKFYYVLDMFEQAPNKIWWELDESNIMKANTGSWNLEEKGKDKTKAVYTLDVKFRGLVPSKITDQIAKANLSQMLSGFQKMINDHAAS